MINFKPIELNTIEEVSDYIKSFAEKTDDTNPDIRILTITLQKSRTSPAFHKGKFLVDLDNGKIIRIETKEDGVKTDG